MAIAFAGANGLFTLLGKIFNFNYATSNDWQQYIDSYLAGIVSAYASPNQAAAAGIPALQPVALQGAGAAFAGLQAAAQATILSIVAADQPSRATNIQDAIAEVIRQMGQQAATVQSCSVSASTTTLANVTNKGNGGTLAIVLTTYLGTGMIQQNIVAEVGQMFCIADSQTGGLPVGNESWNFLGQPDDGQNEVGTTWPTGSAANATITGVSYQGNGTQGNLLTNTDFENWSGSPVGLNNWTITTGAWATDVVKNVTGADVYTGSASLKIVGNAGGT